MYSLFVEITGASQSSNARFAKVQGIMEKQMNCSFVNTVMTQPTACIKYSTYLNCLYGLPSQSNSNLRRGQGGDFWAGLKFSEVRIRKYKSDQSINLGTLQDFKRTDNGQRSTRFPPLSLLTYIQYNLQMLWMDPDFKGLRFQLLVGLS